MNGLLNQIAHRLGAGRDMALALAVIAIISLLVLPIPTWLLDIGLSLSITVSVLILLTALFIEKPIDLAAFPTILLIVTMLRLGLNIASTRLILSHGHEGPEAAGGVIAAFGEFLMGGEAIIGITLFLILLVINFVVITKGSGRIAEVSARFSLDAMPGKQMAIDADLSAGMINEEQAKARRSEIEAESSFFGAMDGASKFVKGDAVAGLLITAVNIIVGLILGVFVHDLPVGEAFQVYTLLTVGDGLVTQIPALIVSIASGLLVTKGGEAGKASGALVEQFTRHPMAYGLVSALMIGFSLLPGLPFLPFASLGAAAGFAAWQLSKNKQEREAAREEAVLAESVEGPVEENISETLAIDAIRLEIGYGLLPLLTDQSTEMRLDDQVRALRRQMAQEYGFVLPTVRIIDNVTLGPDEYVVNIRETEAGRGEIKLGKLLIINPGGENVGLPGEVTTEPVFKLPALWIDKDLRDEAGFRGLTVVDNSTVITTHLTEVVKENISDLLSYEETQKLLTQVHKDSAKLVADIIPARISISGVQRILQNLLNEGVSIRDIPGILEGVAEATVFTQNVTMITEHVRTKLARQICAAQAQDGMLPVVTLSPYWDNAFVESLVGQGEDRQLVMAPSSLQAFVTTVREFYDRMATDGQLPCMLTNPSIRPYVRSVMERIRPATVVLSQNEVHARMRVRNLGVIG
ncbi:flagellar biosynthesis protein FlhA [Sphingorhabdus sp. EL138]|uniref:flagellar biosynthesis protein FlhA n=1 Tax=Sphingorhabdus sp. EL138 TaxID=2073156 RepID=UPI0025F867AB|nr:flagellar biosynthesis protein FlhA [Sphingorhabdus sp. EL138]